MPFEQHAASVGASVRTLARLFTRELGYLPSSFSDMFRRELGAPPSEYRPEETLGHAHGHGDAEPGENAHHTP